MRFLYYFFLFPVVLARLEPSTGLSSEQNNEQQHRKSLSSTISNLRWFFEEHKEKFEESVNKKSVNTGNNVRSSSNSMNNNRNELCEDPMNAVVETLECVGKGDARCANAGYNQREFRKLHNGIDTNTSINFVFWFGAFRILDFELRVDHVYQIGPNQISIRYVEVVTTTDGTGLFLDPSDVYPFSQTFYQHEHALVTVDKDCKMVLWDQTGDNKEQEDVEEIADAVVCRVNPFCS